MGVGNGGGGGGSMGDAAETLYEGGNALSTKPVMHYQGTAYL